DKVTKIISENKKLLEKYDLLIKSRFIEMFGDKAIADGKWKVKKLIDVCSLITDGTHQPPKFDEHGTIPFLFVSNIANEKINYDTNKFINEETYNLLMKRTPVELGDILFSIVGSYGHPAIVKENRSFSFQRHIAFIKPIRDLMDSEYLHTVLTVPEIVEQIERKVKGIAQKTLNLSELKTIQIPVPPLELQQQFADFVQQIDKSKFVVQKSLEKAETLYKSLMQEYFG
ncbi:MAG: restriction endonuclease subunit S, partial [bacterium]|nr:restriction endonuclease subunit S [bacterium]